MTKNRIKLSWACQVSCVQLGARIEFYESNVYIVYIFVTGLKQGMGLTHIYVIEGHCKVISVSGCRTDPFSRLATADFGHPVHQWCSCLTQTSLCVEFWEAPK